MKNTESVNSRKMSIPSGGKDTREVTKSKNLITYGHGKAYKGEKLKTGTNKSSGEVKSRKSSK